MGLHTFYGKFRLTLDHVLYFDHYVALGPGWVSFSSGKGPAGVVDTGFVFWLGKSWSVRTGLKDYVFKEQRVASSGLAQHLIFHLDIGWVLGGSI